MKPLRLAAIAAGAVVAFSSTLHAQSGEVVYYGPSGAYIDGTIKAFGELYPNIRVKAMTGETGQQMTRLAAEKDNPQGDVVYGDEGHFIRSPDLFKPYRSKHHASFPDWALINVNGETYAYGYSIVMQVFVVNTNQMKVADAPKAWKDLTKPQYKGKFMVGNPALTGAGYYSFFQFLQMFGWDETEKYIENARFMSSVNAVPANVGRGEIAIGLVEETKSWELAEQGFPVAVIYPEEGVVPTVSAIGLIKNGPNAENAMLFAEFMNSREGHNVNVATRNRRTPRPDANAPKGLAPLNELKINTMPQINVLESIEKKAEWLKTFDEIFNRKGKKTEQSAS